MTYQIIVEPDALQDLLGIKRYISTQDSPAKANRFVSELKKAIKSLSDMPYRCRKSHYTDEKDTHDLIYKKYTIVFKIIGDEVHILTIFRQRDYPS